MQDTLTPAAPGTRKTPLARTQNSTDVSWLGEGVEGGRGKDNCALIVDEKRELRVIELEPEGSRRDKQLADKHLIALLDTPNKQEHREKVEKVTCHGKGFTADLPSDQEYDAVFWTESAVEKFLYPYYHSQRLWGPKMDELKREFDQDPKAVAIAHRAPSHSSKVASIAVGVIGEPEGLIWMSLDHYLIAAAKSRSNGSRDK